MTALADVIAVLHAWAGSPPPMRGTLRGRFGRFETRHTFWAEFPARYVLREVEGPNAGRVVIRLDREMWFVRPGRVSHRRDGGELTVLENHFSALGALSAPSPPTLIGEVVVLSREASVLRVARGDPVSDEVEFAVDNVSGVVLRCVSRRDGREVAMELEELELGAGPPTELLRPPVPPDHAVHELANREGGSPVPEEVPALVPFSVWGPGRARDLVVASLDEDRPEVVLIWLEDWPDESVVVRARQGPLPDDDMLAGCARVETEAGTVFAEGAPGGKAVVHVRRGGTWITLSRDGTTEQAAASALGLLQLSAGTPELVDR